jgi:hypothetical protein
MKWLRPTLGQKRVVKRFAFVPLKAKDPVTGSDYTVWLEFYDSHEEYMRVMEFDNTHGYYTKAWNPTESYLRRKNSVEPTRKNF